MNAEHAHALAPTALRDARRRLEETAAYLASCEACYTEGCEDQPEEYCIKVMEDALREILNLDLRHQIRELTQITIGLCRRA